MVTKRGAEAAVLVPAHEWRRLQATASKPSLKQLLLSGEARAQLPGPPRGRGRRRVADFEPFAVELLNPFLVARK